MFFLCENFDKILIKEAAEKVSRKAFSLVEIILALCLTGFCIFVADEYFNLNLQSYVRRYALLKEEENSASLKNIKNIIKNGHFARYGKISDKVSASDKKVKILTTFFSKDSTKLDVYTIDCNNNLTTQLNDNKPTTNKEITCSFDFYDDVQNTVTDIDKISVIKMTINQNNEKIVLIQKMMQNN